MATQPPVEPDRIEPPTPTETPPQAPERKEPEAPEIEPSVPDTDQPGTYPFEWPGETDLSPEPTPHIGNHSDSPSAETAYDRCPVISTAG